jgi:threonine dehydratase
MLKLAQELLDGSIVVTLEEIAFAIKLAAERNRVIAEGAAACAIAAALSGKAGSGTIVAIVSGGNIDMKKFCEIVA